MKTSIDFGKNNNRKNGKMLYCKPCTAALNKIVRKRNNAQRAEYNREYRKQNKQWYRDWENANYRKRASARLKQAKDWREKRHGVIRMMHLAARHRAKKKSFAYELSPEIIDAFMIYQSNKCALTGLDFIYESDDEHRYRPFAPSIDRKDNTLGYTVENIQIVCTIVNKARNEYSVELFDQMCLARVEQLNRG